MPNWVFTDYWVTGPDDQLDGLYSVMKELEEREESLVENGFGKNWLGNLVARLGGDPSKVYCRGKWSDTERREGVLYFFVESAWDEPEETRRCLEQRFPGIKIYFQCTGDGIWTTNDPTWTYSNRYYLYLEEEGEEYYDELTEVIAEVERVTGATGLQTLEDCEHALETYSDDNDEFAFNIGEFAFNIGEFEILD